MDSENKNYYERNKLKILKQCRIKRDSLNQFEKEEIKKYQSDYYKSKKFYIKCIACDCSLLLRGYGLHKKTNKHLQNVILILEKENDDLQKKIDSMPKPRSKELQRKYNKSYYKKHSHKVKKRNRSRQILEKKKRSTIDHSKPFDDKINIIINLN
jgi:hypothetical protein